MGAPEHRLPLALVVDDDTSSAALLSTLLRQEGFCTHRASDGAEGVALFATLQPDLVFMDVLMPVMDGFAAARHIKESEHDRFVPLIFLTALSDDETPLRCIEAGGDDYFVKPYSPNILRAKILALRRISGLHARAVRQQDELADLQAHGQLEQELAQHVFAKALVAQNIVSPAIRSVLRPATTFNGDFMVSASTPSGDVVVMLADFTGHGLPAAIMAVPMAQTFRYLAGRGMAPRHLVAALNEQAHRMLPTGMFMAAVIVHIDRGLNKALLWNSGMPEVLIAKAGGGIRARVAPFHPPLGILPTLLPGLAPQFVELREGDHVLLCSDGVVESRNAQGEQFGEARYLAAVSGAPAAAAMDAVRTALDAFCAERSHDDDVSMVAIACGPDLTSAARPQPVPRPSPDAKGQSLWRWRLELQGDNLSRADPVPAAVEQLAAAIDIGAHRSSLFTLISELYSNALEHGVLGLDSAMKSTPEQFAEYYKLREQALATLTTGHICIDLQCRLIDGVRKITIRIEDSGPGFDYMQRHAQHAELRSHGRGIALVRSLCESLDYLGCGNWVVAVFRLA